MITERISIFLPPFYSTSPFLTTPICYFAGADHLSAIGATNVSKKLSGKKISPELDGYSRVEIQVTNELSCRAGVATGRTQELKYPWGMRQMADDILGRMWGLRNISRHNPAFLILFPPCPHIHRRKGPPCCPPPPPWPTDRACRRSPRRRTPRAHRCSYPAR